MSQNRVRRYDLKTYRIAGDGLLHIRFDGADFNQALEEIRAIKKEHPAWVNFIFSSKIWTATKQALPLLIEKGFIDANSPQANTPVPLRPRPIPEGAFKLNQKLLDMMPYKPYQYQLDAAAFAVNNKKGIITLFPGAGKSLIALVAYGHTNFERPLLIVCPASIKTHWQRELRKTLKIKAPILSGKVDKLPKAEAVIINYDILFKNRMLLAGMFSAIIFDEAHYLANDSQRTKAAKLIQTGAEMVTFLSGTIGDRPIKLWHILSMIDPSNYREDNKSWYLQRYCDPKLVNGQMTYGASNLEEFHEKLKPYIFKRTEEECGLEMPERVNIMVETEIEDEDAIKENASILDALDQVEDLDDIEQELVDRIEALSRTCFDLRMKDFFEFIDDKIEEVGKVVIAYKHTAVGELIAHRYKAKRIAGGVPTAKRQDIVDNFESDPEQHVLVLQEVAGSEGFSIYSTNYLVFAEIPTTIRGLIQMQGRIRRVQTKARQCFYYYMKATIDEGESVDDRVLKLLKKRSLSMTMMVDGVAVNMIEMTKTIEV